MGWSSVDITTNLHAMDDDNAEDDDGEDNDDDDVNDHCCGDEDDERYFIGTNSGKTTPKTNTLHIKTANGLKPGTLEFILGNGRHG